MLDQETLAIAAASAIVGFCLSGRFTTRLRDVAMMRNWAHGPRSPRHIHQHPVPRLGGVAIFISFLMVTIFVSATSLVSRFGQVQQLGELWKMLLPASSLFLLGLIDDAWTLPARFKFVMQCIAGSMCYFMGFTALSCNASFLGVSLTGPVEFFSTVFWVVAVVNSVNLIDGLDGLAAGSSLVTVMFLFLVSVHQDNGVSAIAALTLAGTLLGFLRFNFSPATIFMGDCGSLFIGSMLSVLTLVIKKNSASGSVTLASAAITLGLPLIETCVSISRRFIAGRPIFSADREHIHHKLLDLGLTQRQVALVLYAVTASCGLMALFLLKSGFRVIGLVIIAFAASAYLGLQQLRYVEFSELKFCLRKAFTLKRRIANNVKLRNAVTTLSSCSESKEVKSLLVEVFQGEFDGFELILPYKAACGIAERVAWRKHPSDRPKLLSVLLFLPGKNGMSSGKLELYRTNDVSDIKFDHDLLMNQFCSALAECVGLISIASDPAYVSEEVENSTPKALRASVHQSR
jgi:UDP-GlcNAc:undecaprenyl-phosphate GlcNAc-1-phosphate transferase